MNLETELHVNRAYELIDRLEEAAEYADPYDIAYVEALLAASIEFTYSSSYSEMSH